MMDVKCPVKEQACAQCQFPVSFLFPIFKGISNSRMFKLERIMWSSPPVCHREKRQVHSGMVGTPTEQAGSHGNTSEGHLIPLRVGANSPGGSPLHPQALAFCWAPPMRVGTHPHWLPAPAAPGNDLTGWKALRILY